MVENRIPVMEVPHQDITNMEGSKMKDESCDKFLADREVDN
jgi:hypothetical protein